MANSRDFRIDIVRALCALEIIAFWHMMDYLPDNSALTGCPLNFAKLLTNTALATFAFISGLCLSKYHFINKGDVILFYKKRLIRFYPLLLISSFTLLMAGYIFHHHWFTSIPQFLTTICGVNLFFPPKTMTLWYFSMIMFFYMITPLVLYYEKTRGKIISALSVLIVIIILDFFFIDVDDVFYLYYPFYAIGLTIPFLLNYVYKHRLLILPLSLVLFGFMVIVTNNYQNIILGKYVAMISGLLFLFSLASYFNSMSRGEGKVNVSKKLMSLVSYSSMVAYLFHRQIYFVIVYLMGDSNGDLSLYSALGISVPIIFVISFAIQKGYDYLVDKFIKF